MPTGNVTYSSSNPPANVFSAQMTDIGDILYCATSGMQGDSAFQQVLSPLPELEITIQPKSKMRFRYSSEKGSHGTLTGDKAGAKKTVYPTVQLKNYNSQRPAYLSASLYTIEENPLPHVHTLQGQGCSVDGTCTIPFDDTMTAVMQKVIIVFCKTSTISNVIYERKRKQPGCNLQNLGKETEKEVQIFKRNKNMEYVKIRFEAFYYDEFNKPQKLCESIFSKKIMHSVGDLLISRISKVSGLATGGEEVFLLCSKVQKKDIEAVFAQFSSESDSSECDDDGEILWSVKATELEVHHQYAIIFKTPPYCDTKITDPVIVRLFLRQPSTGERSNKISFRYTPVDIDLEATSRKRKKVNPFEGKPAPIKPVVFTHKVKPKVRHFMQERLDQETSHSDYYTEGSPSSSGEAYSPESIDLPSSDESRMALTDFPHLNKHVDEILNGDTCGIEENIDYPLPFEPLEPPKDKNLLLCNDTDGGSSREPYMQTDSVGHHAVHSKKFNPFDGVKWEAQSGVDHSAVICAEGQMGGPIATSPRIDSLCKDLRSKLSLGDKHLSENISNKKLELVSQVIASEKLADFVEDVVQCVNLQDNDGNNLLHLAIFHHLDKPATVHLLCQTLLEILLQRHGESAITSLINQKNNEKQTPLHLAVHQDIPNLLQMLLIKGGNPNIGDYNGDRALHMAVKRNSHNCMEVLLKDIGRVSIDAINNDGITALHCAVQKQCFQCVKLLCVKGASIDSMDHKSGRSTLHLACKSFPEVVEYLVKQPSVNINAQDYSGNTPLHLASASVLYSVVQVLLKHGADPFIRNYVKEDDECEGLKGQVPADLTDNTEIVELLAIHSPAHLKETVHIDNACSNKFSRQCDSKTDENDSGFISGSIPRLNDAVMKQLCKMLDPPNDGWKTLALFLGLDDGYQESIPKLAKSPTAAVINKFLGERNDISSLKTALQVAELFEAAEVI